MSESESEYKSDTRAREVVGTDEIGTEKAEATPDFLSWLFPDLSLPPPHSLSPPLAADVALANP